MAKNITNTASNTLISGTSGNDTIINNNGQHVTIAGGKGDDLISVPAGAGFFYGSEVIKYNAGDGNDTILGFGSNSTLQIGGGNGTYSTQSSGNDVLVKVGKGSIRLKNVYAMTDTIHINDNAVDLACKTVKLTDADSIDIYRESLSVVGSAGNDTINNSFWNNSVTISGGKGNDLISNGGSDVKINGGAGNDKIYNESSDVTIAGGKGSDLISLGTDHYENIIKYSAGDGNDTIYNFTGNDTLSISGGSYSTQASGRDVLVKVGSETITLKNAYATADRLHINKKEIALKKKTISLSDSETVFIARDDISVVGSSGNDSICSNSQNVTINAGAGDDIINDFNSNSSVNGGDGNDYITHESPFRWGTTLNGGAGNDTIKSFNDSIIGGTGDDLISLGSVENMIFYNAGDGNDTVYGFNSTSTLSISGGSYSTQSSGYDLLVKIGAGTITLKNAYIAMDKVHINKKSVALAHKTIKLSGNDSVAVGRTSVSVVGTSSDDTIYNSGDSVTIIGGKGKDYIRNESGNKVSISGGAGNDNIDNRGSNVTIMGGKGNDDIHLDSNAEKNLIQYRAGDGNDTVYNFTNDDTLSIAGGSYSTQKSGYDFIVKVGTGSILLENAYLNLNKLHINKKSVALNLKSVKLTEGEHLEIGRDSLSIVGSAGNDNITSHGSKVTITGNAGDDYINNDGNKVKISGGAGDDNIGNRGSNVTIAGGDGNDNIHNDGGDKVSIYGGAGNDELWGGSGQSTLWGGAGDDELYGGGGKDIFVYKPDEGTDKIFNYNYGNGDMLKILKSDGTAGGTFTKSKYSDGTLSLTISGGGQVIFNGVSTFIDFNINGTSYEISGSKLVKK